MVSHVAHVHVTMMEMATVGSHDDIVAHGFPHDHSHDDFAQIVSLTYDRASSHEEQEGAYPCQPPCAREPHETHVVCSVDSLQGQADVAKE